MRLLRSPIQPTIGQTSEYVMMNADCSNPPEASERLRDARMRGSVAAPT
jgi:hypothetical protein